MFNLSIKQGIGNFPGLLLGTVAIVGLLLVDADPAQAGDRQRSGSYYTGRGGSGTFQNEMHRERGASSRTSDWQNQRGEGQAQTNRQWNREAGTWQSDRNVTGTGGRTAERTKSGMRNEDGSYSVQGSGTTFRGESTTLDRQITPTGNQTYDVSTDRTRGDRSLSTDQTVTRTGSGRTSSGTYQTGGGKSGTFDTDVTRGDGTQTKTQTWTNQDDETRTRTKAQTYEKTDGGFTGTTTVTGPGGETRSRTGGVNFDQ